MISKRAFLIAAMLLAVSATGAMAATVNVDQFVVNNLSIDPTSVLNLSEAGVAAATPYNTILGYLTTGFAGGLWNGPGINSSLAAGIGGQTTLGVNTGAEYIGNNGTKFYDATIAPTTQAVIKYTYAGDLTLDGIVDDNDLGAFLANYNNDGSNTIPTPVNGYFAGDLNYDGFVDDNDLGIFLGNYPSADQGLPPLNNGQFAGAAAAPVPEPSTIVLMVMGLGVAIVALARKRFTN